MFLFIVKGLDGVPGRQGKPGPKGEMVSGAAEYL